MKPAHLALVLLVLASCTSRPFGCGATGTVRLVVSTPRAEPGDVTRVTVSLPSKLGSRDTELVRAGGLWSGVLEGVAPGPDRTLRVQAFNGAGALRYTGLVEQVSTALGTGLVALTLQDVSPPTPSPDNAPPVIDALVAWPLGVAPGGTVSLAARAHDPNAGDRVSQTWTAPSGGFAAPTQASTLWTAPSASGPVRLTLTVSDSRGAALTQNFTVTVSPGGEASAAPVDFNLAPQALVLSSSAAYRKPGQSTRLSASATDPEGGPVSYQWSSACAGTFTQASSATTVFTPSALPTTACDNCPLSVVAKDDRGGQLTGRVALCVSEHIPWAAAARWTPAGELPRPRFESTATALPDGKVLLVAGVSGGAAWQTADLYDPATNTWRPTDKLNTQRDLHTATALPDGTVLAAGGHHPSIGPLQSADVYDPATATWSSTGSLISPRIGHTATALADGRVLVTGGRFYTTPLATAEVYDPATRTWSPTGSMVSPRDTHGATLLADGRVLVMGGVRETGGLRTAELYDPATGTWSATGAMSTPRDKHQATRLPDGRVLVSGGRHGDSPLASAELYDPATGTWSPTGALSTPRFWHTAVVLPDGTVLVAGGNDGTVAQASAEVYVPATGTWTPAAPLSSPRFGYALARLSDGQVLVIGGSNTKGVLSTAERYGLPPEDAPPPPGP